LRGDESLDPSFNFGPSPSETVSVGELVARLSAEWPEVATRTILSDKQFHEADRLELDSSRARGSLGWEPVWGVDRALAETRHWYQTFSDDGSVQSSNTIRDYVRDAVEARLPWATNNAV
jgi:CDP-glucose 4,6-dehydratase